GMPPEARTNTGQRPFLNNFQPSKDANDQETRCNAANFNKFLRLRPAGSAGLTAYNVTVPVTVGISELMAWFIVATMADWL
ncbi:MAG: hypothetical protein WCF17_15405, partial [Terracidiphilus sp.]